MGKIRICAAECTGKNRDLPYCEFSWNSYLVGVNAILYLCIFIHSVISKFANRYDKTVINRYYWLDWFNITTYGHKDNQMNKLLTLQSFVARKLFLKLYTYYYIPIHWLWEQLCSKFFVPRRQQLQCFYLGLLVKLIVAVSRDNKLAMVLIASK